MLSVLKISVNIWCNFVT